MKDNDSGQGIGAVHEAGRAFQDFCGVYSIAVHLHSVFVAPLLAFLAQPVGNHHYAVITQAADNGLGNTAAGGDLADTGLAGKRLDNIGRNARFEESGIQHTHGRRRFTEAAVPGKTGHHHFFELKMPGEGICGILRGSKT